MRGSPQMNADFMKIHSAVYIADDICFTKNGGTAVRPWMLSTISDLLEQYSFQSG